MPTTPVVSEKQAKQAAAQASIEAQAGVPSPISTVATPKPVVPPPTPPPTPTPTPTGTPPPANPPPPIGTPPPEVSAVEDLQAFGDTPEGQAAAANIAQMNEQIASGALSPEEAQRVQEQADATKASYDALIQQANLQKQQGMARDLVAAGQRGGLMNTQFTGIAALTPTVGGNFVGQGGELYRIQSEYDLNISNLQAQQLQAVVDAQDAAREAIKTGKKEDLEAAVTAYNLAKSIKDDHNQMVIDKANALAEFQKSQLELQQFERESASKTIDAIAKAGVDPAEIPEGYFSNLDQKSGYAIGTSEALFYVAQKDQQQLDAAAQIEQASAFSEIFKNMKVGSPPVTIGQSTYSLLNYGDNMTGTETNSTGQWLWTTNNATGQTTVRRFGEATNQEYMDFRADNNDIVRVYADGSKHVFSPTQPDFGIPNPQAMQEIFPDGYKPSDEDLALLGLTQLGAGPGSGIQCGQYARLLGYTGSVTDFSSFETKKSLIDPSIGTPDNPPRAGDAFIQSGGTYGHIGRVLGSTKLDDGSYQISYTDANKNGDGVVHYSVMNSNNVLGFAREGFEFSPEFQFGTDAPSSGLTFSGNTPVVNAYAESVANGSLSLTAIPAEQRDAVVLAVQKLRSSAPASTGLVTLNEDDQKVLDAAPETKKLLAASELSQALSQYKTLLDSYGSTQTYGVGPVRITLQGKQKADLESIYGTIQAKYKTAETLGALDEGVIRAVQNVIRDISQTKNLGQLFQPAKISSQIAGLQSGLTNTAQQNYDLLVAKNPIYANSAYLSQLMEPYKDETQASAPGSLMYTDPNDSEIAEAQANGWMVQTQPDGSVVITPP